MTAPGSGGECQLGTIQSLGGTRIGPNCAIGPDVSLGRNCIIDAGVVIDGWTEIGEGTEVYPFASIGLAITGMVPNADAGPPIVNAVILPLLFLSGVFIKIDSGSLKRMPTCSSDCLQPTLAWTISAASVSSFKVATPTC